MRRVGSQIAKRVVAIVVSVAMTFSLLGVSPRKAQAGIMPASLTSCLSKVAISAVKGSVIWGLGELADATPNDAMGTVFSTTRALIAGKKRVLAEKTVAMLEDITAELDALFSYTSASTRDIETMIKGLAQNDAKNTFQNNAGGPVDTFTNHYKDIVTQFNDLMKAFSAYNEDPSDANRSALELSYNTIYDKYFKGKNFDSLSKQLSDEFTTPLLISMSNDNVTPSFLNLISPYDSTLSVDDSSDLTDPNADSWSIRQGGNVSTTYLGYYRDYVSQITNFQNNVYDSMKDAASLVDNAAYFYLQAYRYYCEFQAMLFASDASLSEDDVREQTSVMWKDYYQNTLKTIRAINQMYYTHEDVFSTYMRSSDVAISRKIQDFHDPYPYDQMLHDYEKANGFDGIVYLEHAGVDYHTPTTSQSLQDFQEYQHIYQFRLVSSPSKAYAIRTSTGMDEQGNPIAEHDGISKAFPVRDMVKVMPGGGLQDQTGPSFDLLTALKGLEGGFIAPVEIKELSDIAEDTITAYDTSVTMVANIGSELSMTFGADNVHLPTIVQRDWSSDEDALLYGPNLQPLRRTVHWTMDYNIFQNPDALMSIGNASMPYSTGNEAFFDLEDNLRDYTGYNDDKHLQNTEAVVMWYCNDPNFSVALSASDGGTTSMTVGDSTLSNGQSGSFDAGTTMTINAKPQDGYTISSVRLVDASGNVLEDLLSDEVFDDGTTITVQEMLQVTNPNADGGYDFVVPMPCQDATVQVDYAALDPQLIPYNVTLNDITGDSGYDAVLQFGSYDFMGEKAFVEGDQVVVSVVGYNHNMSTGLSFKDANNIDVTVSYEDVTSDMQRIRPTERLYAFTMPAQDLVVTPVLGTSNTVSVAVNPSDSVSHAFENLDLYAIGEDDTDWAHADELDFLQNDTVSISYAMKSGYVLSSIEVYDTSKKTVPVTPADGSITFTMPDKDVTVRFEAEELNIHEFILTLDTTDGKPVFQFVDEYGDDMNLTSKQFKADDTVNVRVSVPEGSGIEQITLTTVDSTDNIFEAQEGTYDAETGIATFKMPGADATLSATMHEITPEEADGFVTDDEGKICISTYDELIKFSQAIRSNPDYYSTKDIVLTGNINASEGHWWTQGIGSYADGIYYNGTFNGNGYCIFGMEIHVEGCGCLFEVVGEQGVVKNLNMFNCDSELAADEAGGIADINLGRIENCVNGVSSQNAVNVQVETGELISLEEYNSYVDAMYAGGIVNENHGTIFACRNAADVKGGYYGGGIVALNRGVISNCAGSGQVRQVLPQDDALHYGGGGISGKNDTSIEGGYSSATVDAADVGGSITGVLYGEIADTYYTTSDGQQECGYSDGSAETNVNGLTREEMAQDSFVDLLMSTPSNSVTWIRNDGLNGGLPRIMNTSAAFNTVSLESGDVSVSGNMHTSAKLVVSEIPSDSEAGKLLSASGDSGVTGVAYACDLQDADGNQIPAELWVQSDLTYTVPATKADVGIAVMLADGRVMRLSDVSVKEADSGYEVTFTSDYAVAFMVLNAEPEPEPTPDDGFDRDEDGNILIGSYQELVKFSQLVRQSPQTYSTADVKLSNNIKATDEEAWTQGIGSKADNISYNGTFEGNGYCIYGLDVNTSQNAGLFEVIGQNGVVRNLFLFDCDGQVHADVAGGIAAYNYGRIEFCVNGVNFGNGVYIDPKTNEMISLRELNSTIDAGVGGGIAGNNYGTIYGCRSAAVIQGDSVGSMAGINDGTVSNCAGNSSVSSAATDSCDCGGLVGSNGKDGVVEAGYSSATISSTVPYCGSIAGAQLGSVADTYYTTSEDQQPFGTPSESSGTNINGLRRGEMMEDSFLDLLSAVGSNSVTWIRHDSLNAGLPRIKNTSAAFADVTLTGENIVVKGNLHTGASVAMTTISSESEAWKALAKNVDGYTAVTAYSTVILDDAGNKIPDELWAQSALTYTVPVPGADVAIKVLDRNGNTKQLDDVTVDKADTGYQATFTADGVGAILVLQRGSGSGSGSGGTGNAGTGNGGGTAAAAGTTTVATRTASTGDVSKPLAVVVLLAGVAVLLIAGGMMWKRRDGIC